MWNFNVKKPFDKVVEWDKKLIKKFQDGTWGKLTDYQVVVISIAKGFVIGAILL